jgi:hypothetical protein
VCWAEPLSIRLSCIHIVCHSPPAPVCWAEPLNIRLSCIHIVCHSPPAPVCWAEPLSIRLSCIHIVCHSPPAPVCWAEPLSIRLSCIHIVCHSPPAPVSFLDISVNVTAVSHKWTGVSSHNKLHRMLLGLQNCYLYLTSWFACVCRYWNQF